MYCLTIKQVSFINNAVLNMGIVYEEIIVLLTVHTLFRKEPRKIGASSEDTNTMTCQTIWGTNAEAEGLSLTNAT